MGLEQLSYLIGTVYGAGMDTAGYLRRFIDMEYKLEKIKLGRYISECYTDLNERIIKIEIELFEAFDFSLRDYKKIFDNLKMKMIVSNFFNRKYNRNISLPRMIGLMFMLLKYKYPIMYIKIIN